MHYKILSAGTLVNQQLPPSQTIFAQTSPQMLTVPQGLYPVGSLNKPEFMQSYSYTGSHGYVFDVLVPDNYTVAFSVILTGESQKEEDPRGTKWSLRTDGDAPGKKELVCMLYNPIDNTRRGWWTNLTGASKTIYLLMNSSMISTKEVQFECYPYIKPLRVYPLQTTEQDLNGYFNSVHSSHADYHPFVDDAPNLENQATHYKRFVFYKKLQSGQAIWFKPRLHSSRLVHAIAHCSTRSTKNQTTLSFLRIFCIGKTTPMRQSSCTTPYPPILMTLLTLT
jgi:hypothetical protein